jgi:hypothetical protein
VIPLPHFGSGRGADKQANSMTPDQAMAQVVGTGRQLRKVARLEDVSGGGHFQSCDDVGSPPYRGYLEMSSLLPPGVTADAYARQVADAMIAAGWTAGAPPGKSLYGTVIHQGGVMVVMGGVAHAPSRLSITIYGECRDLTNHRDDGGTVGRDLTDELNNDS